MDITDYLDPDGFAGDLRESILDIPCAEKTYPLVLHLTSSQMTRLSITITDQAQKYEFQARRRERKTDGESNLLTSQLRGRADDTRSLVNAYRTAAGLPRMTADDILNW